MTDGGVRVVGDDQRHDIETNLQVFSIVSACEKLSDLEILPTLFAVDGFAGKAFLSTRSRLHLGEHQDVIITRDDIRLAGLACPVARDDLITARHQVTRRDIFP